jgi:hypothetical protein
MTAMGQQYALEDATRDVSIVPTAVVRENSQLSETLNTDSVIRMRAPPLVRASARCAVARDGLRAP